MNAEAFVVCFICVMCFANGLITGYLIGRSSKDRGE